MTNYTVQLKKHWKTESLSFIALFTKFKEKEGFFNDLVNPVSLKKLFYPEYDNIRINQKKVSFYVPNASKYIDGHYYKIDLEYSDSSKIKNNPYSLHVSSVTQLNQQDIKKHLSGTLNDELLKKVFQIKSFLDRDIAKEHIKQRYERRTKDPDGNKIIANLMLEIGAGMYSSKQRMIFELLQNADDAPGKEKVEFHIDINGDYFFVMHDGVSFSKEDINAITSAAQSTKKKDKKKTGYKGIGFKSVFTNSTEVWLKSGGYQFAFLRNSSLFKNFDDFYFSSKRHKKHPEYIVEDKLLYAEQRNQFNSSTDIPWQIIPIWQDKLPSEFNDSNFSVFDNTVQFALKVGTNHIYSADGYLNAIDNIVKRPQFLLFLRNTSKFRSPKNRVTVTRIDNENLIEIEKTTVEYIGNKIVYHQDKFNYLKISYPDIEVSNESFLLHNIDLKKSIREINQGEVYEFVDLNDELIETIPPKLATVNETEISFGIKITDNKIAAENGYLKGLDEYSSLFTYLPMEDKRFKLPFLVNADFIPDSRRESLQGDNPWNKYIMIRIAEKHIETIAHFTSEFIKDNTIFNSYLSLLLMKLLPEDDTAQQIIDSYNKKYIEQLNIVSIVVNDKNQSQLLSETIYDTSGLIELFGHEIFYEIIETQKRLPNSNLDANYLKEYGYLDIELINLEELANSITPKICERFGVIIAEKSIYENPELLKWLNKLVKFIPDDFGKIPFIVHNNALFSLELLIDESDAWLINEHTSDYSMLIEELGYNTIQLNLDQYTNIKEYLHSLNGYINDKTLAYERIASNTNINKLAVTSKLKLLDFFQNSAFMIGVGVDKYFGKLKLFIDETNNPRPIRQLLSRDEDLEVESINNYRIKESEFNSLTDDLQKQLIAKDEIFTSFILDEDLFEEWSQQFDAKTIKNYVSDLKAMYNWIDNPDDIYSAQWASIPWLYLSDDIKFVTADKTYWSNAFNELSNHKYETIKSVFQNQLARTLPVQACGELIKVFPIKTDDASDLDWTKVVGLEMLSANILLDWMEVDGDFGEFFKNHIIEANVTGDYSIVKIETEQIFDGSENALKTYIESSTELSALFIELDKNLCSENRSMIGLLQGDKLIKSLIESGAYDQNLAIHLPSNLQTELLNSFVINLNEFKLVTDTSYGTDTAEHFIVNSLLRSVEDKSEILPEIQNILDEFRSIVSIDGNPLSNYTVSERVTFGTKEDIKVLKLSDILTVFQGESDVLDNVKESFTAITQKAKLKKLIFRTEQLKPAKIHHKIETETSSFYTPYQVAFQLLDESYGGNRNWSKQRFDKFYIEKDNLVQLHNSYREFLDVLLELPLSEISDFKFQDLTLKNCVDKNFTIESEHMPDWLLKWVKKDSNRRLDFLANLGYNDANSPIVSLRKAMVADDYDQNTVIKYLVESKPNVQIIWNSILWLSNYNPNIITRNISVIKQINDYIKIQSNGTEEITIPLIESINTNGDRAYSLQALNIETELFKISVDSEFSDSIFSSISSTLNNPYCIDENIGNLSEYLNITLVQLETSIDNKTLESESTLWEEAYYTKWEYFNNYPIYIFEGEEIPYRRTFRDKTINTFTRDMKVANDGKYYVSKVLKKDILNNLPGEFPDDMLSDLIKWYYKTNENPSLLDEDSFDYKENIDRLLQDRLGITEEDQKRENGNAKTHAVYFLDKNGFDVTNVNNAGAALTNIKDPDGKQVNCIVRSAKGGLLYLDKEHWDMMEDNLMYLIVIYPGNSPRLFKDRLELLEEELAENVLFRVPNNKFTPEIDGVFKALESESHLILVTSEKMRESLFSKLKQKKEFNKEDNAAIAGDEFKF